jgi:2-(1,2-epoxy-1,2-dihydrophenyl)acetyl-CoA isomerase
MSYNYESEKLTHLEVEHKSHTLFIYLDNPQMRNAFTIEMIESFEKILPKADRDPDILAIVIGARGSSFSAGGDIKLMEKKEGMFAGEPFELMENYRNGIQRIPRLFESINTPTIAMINGACVGAGCDFTCMMDLRIAGPNAMFKQTFSNLSLVPGDGGTYFLTRAIGFSRAMEMYLLGDTFKAHEAKEIGLVHKLADSDEDLVELVEKVAKKIAKKAPKAVRATKNILKRSYHEGLHEQLEMLSLYQGMLQNTPEHIEGLLALKEKRSPKFN